MTFCQFFHCLFYWNISVTGIHYGTFVSFFYFNLKAWIRTISYTFSNNVFTNTVIVLYHESQVNYSQWPMSFCFLYYSITYYSVLLYCFSVLFYCIISYRRISFESVIWTMVDSKMGFLSASNVWLIKICVMLLGVYHFIVYVLAQIVLIQIMFHLK